MTENNGEYTGDDIGVDPHETMDEAAGENQQESYGQYSVDDEDQLQPQDTLVDDGGVEDVLDEGYSPPDDWSAAEGYGNTPYEEEQGETLGRRVEQEVPEPDPYEAAEAQQTESVSGEVGEGRTGRLVAEDEGVREDGEKDLVAENVDMDGRVESAEEDAVRIVDEEP